MANTFGIANALSALTLTAQVGGASALKTGVVGQYKDLIGQVPCSEVIVDTDMTERETMNAPGNPVEINDTQLFPVILIVDATNGVTAWQSIMQVRDAVTALFHAQLSLGVQGVDGVWLEGGGKYSYFQQNGRYFLSYRINVHVRYDYLVTLAAS